ncbi:MAG: YdjY domain-containing protein [Planctomycetota bacterium]
MGYVRPFIQLSRRNGTALRWSLAGLAGAGLLAVTLAGEGPGARARARVQELPPAAEEPAADDAALVAALGAAGIRIDREAGAVAFSARVEILNELLEYLIVSRHGAVHESLFTTDVDPEVLAAAVLAAGALPGNNVEFVAKDPPPTREEVRAGARTHDVVIPTGEPIYVYATWREAAGPADVDSGDLEGETLFFHRIEDLVLDLVRGRTMRRHGWVWLGSRMVPGRTKGEGEVFAATATGNLVCISFFSQGDTLMTTALPECTSQTAWRPNVWMVPDRGSEVLLLVSTRELDGVPASLRDAIPFVEDPEEEDGAEDPAKR